MKLILITLTFIIVSFTAKAQKIDTTIYYGCDTTLYAVGASKLDSCPEFNYKGLDLVDYISANIRYKNLRKHPNVKEPVMVEMVIEADGSLSHIKVVNSLAPDLDKEALRIISALPKWKPGILHGQNVRVRYWASIFFKFHAKA